MAALGDLDRARIGELYAQELARFRDVRPRSLAMISRARAHMPNGVPMAWMASDNDQPVYIDHGEGLVDSDGGGQVSGGQRGLPKGLTGRVRIAQFNDADTLRRALGPGDVALVLTEPVMTNSIHLLPPEPGWHEALRDLTRRYGT